MMTGVLALHMLCRLALLAVQSVLWYTHHGPCTQSATDTGQDIQNSNVLEAHVTLAARNVLLLASVSRADLWRTSAQCT